MRTSILDLIKTAKLTESNVDDLGSRHIRSYANIFGSLSLARKGGREAVTALFESAGI